MRKLLFLLLGLLLIFILSYFCFLGKAENVQNDLLTKAEKAYNDKSMNWVSPKIKGHDLETTRILTLTGTTDSLLAKEEAEKIAQTLEGITSIDNQIVIQNSETIIPRDNTPSISTITPYILNITKKNNTLTLNGYVPNIQTHQKIIEEAQNLYGKDYVIDELKEASTAPIAWKETIIIGLTKLAMVEHGHCKMENETFNFEGYVGTIQEKTNLLNELQETVASSYIDTYNIKVPTDTNLTLITSPTVSLNISPYILEATMLKNKNIILNGYVEDNISHQKIITQVEILYGKEHITDNLKEAPNAPTAWINSITLGLDKLATMNYGYFKMKDETFNFEGFIGTEQNKTDLLQDFKENLASNYIDTYNIETPQIKTLNELALDCQKQFKTYLSNEKINFAYDKALIKQESYLLLSKLIVVAKSCPESKLFIEGHTDSDGSQKYNQKLSKKRANAVKNYLEKYGISNKRLKSIGYGELHPIASNKTVGGKKENRRIEINLKGVK